MNSFSKDQLRLLDSEKSRLPRPIQSLLDWTPGLSAMRPGLLLIKKTWDESTMGVEHGIKQHLVHKNDVYLPISQVDLDNIQWYSLNFTKNVGKHQHNYGWIPVHNGEPGPKNPQAHTKRPHLAAGFFTAWPCTSWVIRNTSGTATINDNQL